MSFGQLGIGGRGTSGGTSSAATALPLTGNIVCRFGADQGTSTTTDNTGISTWTDQINGITANQAAGPSQPKYRTNKLNGLPSVQFTAASAQNLSITSAGALKTAIDSGSYSVFIAFRGSGTLSSTGAMLAVNNLVYFADGAPGDGVNTGLVGLFTGGKVPYAGQTAFSTIGSSALTVAQVAAYGITTGSPQQNFYVNGGSYSSLAIAPQTTGGLTTINIGVLSGSTFPFSGEIFEIVVWNTFLTPPQMKQAQMWADDKYGQPYPWNSVPYVHVIHSDSHMNGSGNSGGTLASTFPFYYAQQLGLQFGQWDSLGITGIRMVDMTALAPTWVDPIPQTIKKPMVLICGEYFNQNAASPTPFNNSKAYLAARKAVPGIYTLFATSIGTISDSGAFATNRAAYNASFDAANAVINNIDAYCPIHLDPQIGVIGSYASFSNQFWSGDTLHLNSPGQLQMALEVVSAYQKFAPAYPPSVAQIYARQFTYKSGKWYNLPDFSAPASPSATFATGTMVMAPFVVIQPVTIKGLGLRVTTAGSSTFQLAIYKSISPSISLPGILLDKIPQTVDTNANTIQTASLSNTTDVLFPGLYWIAMLAGDNTLTYSYAVNIQAAQTVGDLTTTNVLSGAGQALAGYTIANTYASGPPLNVSTALFTASYNLTTMTVTAVTDGQLQVGQTLFGNGIAGSPTITAYGVTTFGDVGTYTISVSQSNTGSGAMTAAQAGALTAISTTSNLIPAVIMQIS